MKTGEELTAKERLEGNLIIATYMDGSTIVDHSLLDDDTGARWVRFKHFKVQNGGEIYHCDVQDLKYHSSWKWILHVVDDIKYARRKSIVVWNEPSHPSCRLYKDIEKALLNLSVKQTFDAVVKLITWYNTTY